MFKTTNGKAGRIHYAEGTGLKGRNTNYSDARTLVSDRAQAPPLDINTIRQFSFGLNDSSTLPQRPSTSGGPRTTSDFPLRRDARKRETKDDLDCLTLSVIQRKRTTFYDFPLPGGLPTPDSSPSYSSRPSQISSPAQLPTPDSLEIDQNMNGVGMEIGMAIGSPTQAPPWQIEGWRHIHSPSPGPTETSIEASQTPPKQKTKWKIFGGLFGGKKQTTGQAQNFYQLQLESTPTEPARQPPIRIRTIPDSSTETMPEVRRANTAPKRFNLNPHREQNPEILLDGSRLEENEKQWGMLNVDIPSVEMERYSVMFGSLLQKQPGTTPSLLARRQATLDRLMAVNEELAQKEQELEEKEKQIRQPRRATSPQPTKSPAFSLFPSTPSRESRLARTTSPSGRLVRSNTSPAALSPSRPSFAPGSDNNTHATLLAPGPHIPIMGYDSDSAPRIRSASIKNKVRKQPDSKTVVKSAQQQQQQQQQQTWVFTPDQSQLTLSPESDSYDTSPLPTTTVFQEPNRQTASKSTGQHRQPSVSGSATSSSDHSTSSSFSTTISGPHSSTQSFLPRSVSPHEGSTIREHQMPMSKFTSPPQVHKSRGRSATTSIAPKVNHQQAEILSFKPRPSETSGPRALTSSVSQTGLNQNAISNFPQSGRGDEKEKREAEDEEEARLKTLVEVSIARQISVSRQQRHYLIPINGGSKPTPSTNSPLNSHPINTNSNTRPAMRARASTVSTLSPTPSSKSYNQNFPSPLLKNLQPGTSVSYVTSPLTAVAKATKEEWNNTNYNRPTPNASSTAPASRNSKEEEAEGETIVVGMGPSTPTLVIIDANGRSRSRPGSESSTKNRDGIAERRRKARAEKSGRGHEYKKSENAVVERA